MSNIFSVKCSSLTGRLRGLEEIGLMHFLSIQPTAFRLMGLGCPLSHRFKVEVRFPRVITGPAERRYVHLNA